MQLLLLMILLVATPVFAQSIPPVGFDFDHPTLLADMPDILEEISGLSGSPQEGEFLAIQDEDGEFFRLTLSDGRFLGSTKFHEDDDYEGIEAVGQDIWIVKSSGTLYRIRRPGLTDQEVTKFNGFLNRDNDVEGLAYDRRSNRLLLACKSRASENKEVRSVFAFDLKTNNFQTRPIYEITRSDMEAYLQNCPRTSRHQKILDFVVEKDDYELGPSAIAVHPITGQIFVVSSPGKLVIILDARGNIQHIRRLDKDIFPQPEGIMFLADGTMLMSTEAKGGDPGRVYRLPYQPGFDGL